MKRKFQYLLTTLLAGCSLATFSLALSACGEDPAPTPGPSDGDGKVTYKTTVLMPNNAPATDDIQVQWCTVDENGVILNCFDPVVIDDNGEAEIQFDEGTDLAVHLLSLPDNYYYDESAYFVSEEERECTIKLISVIEPRTGRGTGSIVTDALGIERHEVNPYNITREGNYKAKVNSATKKVYFAFTPQTSGVYKLESVSAGYDAKIERYVYSNGGVAGLEVVQSDDNGAQDERNFLLNMEVKNEYVGNVYLFAISIAGAPSYPATVILNVSRTGDADPTPISTPAEFVIPEEIAAGEYYPEAPYGAELVPVDWYDANTSVVLGTDGFYHLGAADGPVVVVRITKSGEYLDRALTDIVVLDGSFAIVMNDEEERVNYHSFFANVMDEEEEPNVNYGDYANSDGVYGLTEEMKTALELIAGKHSAGWFGTGTDGTLNGVEHAVPAQNQWMFVCYTYTEGLPTDAFTSGAGTQADPYIVDAGKAYEVQIQTNATVYFKINQDATDKINVLSNDKAAKMYLDGAQAGVKVNANLDAGTVFSVKTEDGSAKNILILTEYLKGSRSNPYELTLGGGLLQHIDEVGAVNYYTLSIPANATYTLTLDTGSGVSVSAQKTGDAPVALTSGTPVEISAGETACDVTISVTTNELNSVAAKLLVQDLSGYADGDGTSETPFTVSTSGDYRIDYNVIDGTVSVYVKIQADAFATYSVTVNNANALLSQSANGETYQTIDPVLNLYTYQITLDEGETLYLCFGFKDVNAGGYYFNLDVEVIE